MEKVNLILFGKILSLLKLQAQAQIETKCNIKIENLNTFESFGDIVKIFFFENLFNVSQRILIDLILQEILFPLCDLLKNELNTIVDNLVENKNVEKLIQETYKRKFEELKQKFKIKKDINYYPAPQP